MKYIIRDPEGNAKGMLDEKAFKRFQELVRGHYRMAKYADALLKVFEVDEDNSFGTVRSGIFVYVFKGDVIVQETEED